MKIAIALCFIAFDMATGVLKAWKNKQLKSSRMREGLFNKAGFIMTIALGLLIDKAQEFLDLGFQVELTIAIVVFIILTEIVSIFENICAISPVLSGSKLGQYLMRKEAGDE